MFIKLTTKKGIKKLINIDIVSECNEFIDDASKKILISVNQYEAFTETMEEFQLKIKDAIFEEELIRERARIQARAELLNGMVVKMDDINKKIQDLIELRNIQGRKGNYDYDDYMLGLFNGLELAVSTLEGREPNFKSKGGKNG